MYGLNSDLMKQYQLQQVGIWPQVSKIIGKSSLTLAQSILWLQLQL